MQRVTRSYLDFTTYAVTTEKHFLYKITSKLLCHCSSKCSFY